jgi:hypothetical protein
MKKYLPALCFVLAIGIILPQVAFAAWWNPFTWFSASTPAVSHPVSSQSVLHPQQTTSSVSQTGPCKISGAYPDPKCTPGVAFSNVTATDVCASGYSSSVRNVSTAEKNQVYAEYGITSHATGQYEVDHFISLELGGSNDLSNLWPEPAKPTPGFHEKDKVENYLHSQLCSGKITLVQAQQDISVRWLAIYASVYGGVSPAAIPAQNLSSVAPLKTAPTLSAQPPIQTQSAGAFYTSSYGTAKYYYPATCSGWKSLSTSYLKSFGSLGALLVAYPSRVEDPRCK